MTTTLLASVRRCVLTLMLQNAYNDVVVIGQQRSPDSWSSNSETFNGDSPSDTVRNLPWSKAASVDFYIRMQACSFQADTADADVPDPTKDTAATIIYTQEYAGETYVSFAYLNEWNQVIRRDEFIMTLVCINAIYYLFIY